MSNKNYLPVVLIVAIAIIGFLSFKFIFSNPGKTGSLDERTTASADSQISLSTNPNPPKLGKATLVIAVKDKDGKAVDNAKVFFDLNMTAMNMGTQQGEATAQGNGQYAATGSFSMGGLWAVKTKVTMPGGEIINKDFTINVYQTRG